MKKKRDGVLLGLTAGLFVLLAIVFGIYDLRISKAVVDIKSGFGLAFEFLGYVIPPVFASLAGVTVTVYYYKALEERHRLLKLALGFIAVLAGLGYCCYEFSKLTKLGSLGAVLTTSLLLGIAAAWLLMQGRDRLYSLVEISVIVLLHFIVMLLVVNLLKMVWGRVRYREMEDATQFSNWFLPQGFTGHHSFPSGHTSGAATLWGLTLFAALTEKKWLKALCYVIPALWIAVMAFSRVLAGAHYASDVLFGAAISIVLFYLVKWFVKKHWKAAES